MENPAPNGWARWKPCVKSLPAADVRLHRALLPGCGRAVKRPFPSLVFELCSKWRRIAVHCSRDHLPEIKWLRSKPYLKEIKRSPPCQTTHPNPNTNSPSAYGPLGTVAQIHS